jgi:ABC-type phosphate transport system permease subunit
VEAREMRIVITLRTVFNLLVIAILIGIAAGIYL